MEFIARGFRDAVGGGAMTEKQELRKMFLARRAALDSGERRAADAEICANLLKLELFREAPSIALYVSDGTEPDLSALVRLAPDKRFLLPRYVAADGAYELVEVTNWDTQLRRGRYGLLEPLESLPAAEEERIRHDVLFLVPAVACDRRGGRLGRGGGFYDRLLALPERPALAVIYHCQWSERILPLEAHDRLIGYVVTEREIYEVPQGAVYAY